MFDFIFSYFQVLLGEEEGRGEEDDESKGAMSPIYKSVDGGSSAGGDGKTFACLLFVY